MSQPPPPPGGPFQQPPPGNSYPGPGPQQPWHHQQPGQWPPAPPPKRSNGWKWALGAVALMAVIGLTAAVTLSVSSDGTSNDGSPPVGSPTAGNGAASDIASADDNGPITIITEDPSCAPARPILDARATAQRNGWDKRDPSIPATEWSPAVRAQYEAVGDSMRSSADQLVPIAKMTPHRVLRELYEQIIAYSRAYADSIPAYDPPDDHLAATAASAADAMGYICGAISYGSAAERAPLVSPSPAPPRLAPLRDPGEAQRFLTEPNPVCTDWEAALAQFNDDTAAWLVTDPNIPVSQWTPEQKALNDEVAPVMRTHAAQLQELGVRSNNPILRDLAELSAQYRRAYVEALPTYSPGDQYLANAAFRLSGVINAGCRAAGGS